MINYSIIFPLANSWSYIILVGAVLGVFRFMYLVWYRTKYGGLLSSSDIILNEEIKERARMVTKWNNTTAEYFTMIELSKQEEI